MASTTTLGSAVRLLAEVGAVMIAAVAAAAVAADDEDEGEDELLLLVFALFPPTTSDADAEASPFEAMVLRFIFSQKSLPLLQFHETEK